MDITSNKFLELKNKATNLLKALVYHPLYVVVFAFITLLSYLLDVQFIGFFCFTIVAIPIFLLLDDVWPILPLLALVTFLFRKLDFSHPIFIAMLIPIGISLILHFFLFPIKSFKGGFLFLPLILVSITLFSGGLFSRELSDYPKGLVTAITIGPGILFIYWFFRQFINPPENFDFRTEFFRILLACGLVVGLETLFQVYHTKVLNDGMFNTYHMGWANVNSASVIIMISSPACFYFILKDKVFLPNLIFLATLIVSCLLSSSDACSVIMITFSAIMLVGTYIKLKKPTQRLILLLECFVICIIAILFLCFNIEIVNSVLDKILASVSYDNGRTRLYKEAWALFVKGPIFGASLGYYNDAFLMDQNALTYSYFFHSTFFEVIASTGIVGLTAYVYYFVQRYRILTNNNSTFNTLCYISFSLFEIYGFLDVVEFSIIPHMIFATLIILVAELNNLSKVERLPLTE